MRCTWELTQDKMNKLPSDSTRTSLNELSLNVNKTVFMALGIYSYSVPNILNICIGNKEIERAKYLGIIIDDNMKWNKHSVYC